MAARPRRRWIRKALSVGFALVVMLLLVLWFNRYNLIETRIIRAMNAQGYQAELSIASLSRSRAIVNDITITHTEQSVFSAGRITLDYQWQDALNRKIDRVTVVGAQLDVAVDQDGTLIHQPIDNALWQSRETSPDQAFPVKHVHVMNSKIRVKSPYGDATAVINADFKTPSEWKADINLIPTDFVYGDISGSGGGHLVLQAKGKAPEFNWDLSFNRLVIADAYMQDLHVNGKANVGVKPDEPVVESDLTLTANLAAFATPSLRADGIDVTWAGNIAAPRDGLFSGSSQGQWQADIETISVTDAGDRQRLANTLSLHTVLSRAPITDGFAPTLTASVQAFLAGSRLSGAGEMGVSESGYFVSLDAPLKIDDIESDSSIVITPTPSQPLLAFDQSEETLAVNGALNFSGALPLKISDMQMTAQSVTGYRIDQLIHFSGQMMSEQMWQVPPIQPEQIFPTRLAPFSVDVAYGVPESGEPRIFEAVGKIDYDGQVPGGVAKDLKAAGRLDVTLTDRQLAAHFTPEQKSNAEKNITLQTFLTPLDWRGERVSFNLSPDGASYRARRDPDSGKTVVGRISAQMMDMDMQLVETAKDQDIPRQVDMEINGVDVAGTLAGIQQNWRFDATDAVITSDAIPDGGLEFITGEALGTVRRRGDDPPEFTLTTPSADIRTRTVNAKNMAMTLKGMPSDLEIDYSKGQVTFAADGLPTLPLMGQVTLKGSVWSGAAQTSLPRAESSPIDIQYRLEDGYGSADVVIKDLIFQPEALQPQSLVPTLRGKVAEVEGRVNANIQIAFGPDQPLISTGSAQVIDMNLGTLPGPIEGLNTDLSFASFFPLQTDGPQTLTLARFDPGIPLKDGEIEFELIPDGIKLYRAFWPIVKDETDGTGSNVGSVAIDPTEWIYDAPKNQITLRVDQVPLEDLIGDLGGERLEVIGDMSGTLPVVLQGVSVEVQGGSLDVKDGGVIRYKSEQTAAAAARNQYADMAFKALEDFHYEALEASIDGPLDGDMIVRANFDGSNPDVLSGAVFAWDVSLEGQLLNIARSVKDGTQSLENVKKIINAEPG